MFIFLSRLGRLFIGATVVVAVTAIFGINTLTTSLVGSRQASTTCSVSPSSVALNQSFTITATGLPNSSVNLVRIYPNGSMEIMAIPVSSGGTYTIVQSSADSVFPSQQTGTYTYKFVGRVKWPAGTYSTTYETCSVNVA